MGLTTEEQILIEQRVANDGKSIVLSYVFWLFFGLFGAHRLYLNEPIGGFAIFLLTAVGIIFARDGFGVYLLIASAIFVLIDVFLIPGLVGKQRQAIREKLTDDALAANSRSTENQGSEGHYQMPRSRVR